MPSRVPRAALAGALLFLFAALPASARQVVVPLQLDYAFMRKVLVEQVFTGPDHTARMWDDGVGCNLLVLSDPQIDSQHERLRIRSVGQAHVGIPIFSFCIPLFSWNGTVEVLEEAVVTAGQPVVGFRVVDSNLYGAAGEKRVSGTLWDWVKRYVHPRLDAVTVDLGQPLGELRAFLAAVLPHESDAQAAHLLASLTLVDARPIESALTVDLRFDVPEIAAASPTLPEPAPTLSEEELARWEASWQQWDAFLTFVSKQAASDTVAAAQRQALFDVLIEARRDILWVLRPSGPNQPDPVPMLFVRTWTRLAPVLRQLSLGLPGEEVLHYVSFITAADALRALAEIGPSSGLDISADGLRRLARMIAPASPEDPLVYSDAIDPTLRELFGFGSPLPPPEENPDVDMSWWPPARAWASDLSTRLNRWAPTRDDVQEYLPLVRDLLNQTADQTLAKDPLEAKFHKLYGWMVLATAWKESCWRQFVRVGERLQPVRSPVGAVGIMQVNPRVWRGLYDVKGLNQDIGYNALAGSEILMHYLRDYAIAKGEHTITGDIDNLARATYAAYNGGPGHLTRYRTRKGNRSLRKIDDSFWDKYRTIKGGQTLAVQECF